MVIRGQYHDTRARIALKNVQQWQQDPDACAKVLGLHNDITRR
jgi:hypothetical protein